VKDRAYLLGEVGVDTEERFEVGNVGHDAFWMDDKIIGRLI